MVVTDDINSLRYPCMVAVSYATVQFDISSKGAIDLVNSALKAPHFCHERVCVRQWRINCLC